MKRLYFTAFLCFVIVAGLFSQNRTGERVPKTTIVSISDTTEAGQIGKLYFSQSDSNFYSYSGSKWLLLGVTNDGSFYIKDGDELRFYDVGNSNYVGFKAPALSANQIWTLPTADGEANQILYTDGSGNLDWVDNAGSGVSWYGVSWDAGFDADTYTRLGSLADSAASASIPDALLPIQSRMKRCVLKNDGTVNYYLRSDNSTLKENGDAANLTGADGQVMVEIPKFYYYFHYDGTDSIFTWKVSLDSIAGYERHPAFYKDSAYVDYRYIGAYEATLYDVSNSAYINGLHLPTTATWQYSFIDGGANVDTVRCVDGTGTALTNPFTNLEAGDQITISGTTSNNITVTVVAEADTDFTVATGTLTTETSSATITAQVNFAADTLASVSGKAPVIQGTRANFRTAANLRGSGWRQQDYQLISAVQLLYLVEYASFYSQSKIGNGLTDWVGGTWQGRNDYNPIEKTGNSNNNGNATANTSGGDGVTGSYMSYRGIENFYGHLWKWVDGFNINDNIVYINNDEEDYADNTAVNYEQIGTLVNSDGWQKYLLNNKNGFLPVAVGAASSSYITDYYYRNTGWRVARFGGNSSAGANAGVFSWGLANGSGSADRFVSARIAF